MFIEENLLIYEISALITMKKSYIETTKKVRLLFQILELR
jgi:hypothetical protein